MMIQLLLAILAPPTPTLGDVTNIEGSDIWLLNAQIEGHHPHGGNS